MKHKEVVISLAIWGGFWFLAIIGESCTGNPSMAQPGCQLLREHSDILGSLTMVLFFGAIISTFACIFIPIINSQLP